MTFARAESALIVRSLEMAGERAANFERRVFENLSAVHPEFDGLFALDRDFGVRGSMVETCIRCILDHVEGGEMARRLIEAERLRHDGYGVVGPDFDVFWGVIRNCVRDAAGEDWGADMDGAWAKLVVELGAAGKSLG